MTTANNASPPAVQLVTAGSVILREHYSNYAAASHNASAPLPSAVIPDIVSAARKDLAAQKLVFPTVDSLLERCVVALLGGHLLLGGPPGTGKTSLALALSRAFNVTYDIVTATSEWTTFDVLGGLQPTKGSFDNEVLVPRLGCVPTAAIKCSGVQDEQAHGLRPEIANWLIIDEFNRADIDKAFGPLYTVLGGSGRAAVDLWFEDAPERRSFLLPERFRIIGTLNETDTFYVNGYSQALSRRFQYVRVGAPKLNDISDEVKAAFFQAGRWYAERYVLPTGSDSDHDWLADRFVESASVVRARTTLADLVKRLRYDSTEPWEIGSAQLVDVARSVAIRTPASPADADDALDLAVADRLVPQLSELPGGVAEGLHAYLTAVKGWRVTTESLERVASHRSQ